MNLQPLAANKSVMIFNNGNMVLFSYDTPVAAFVEDRGWLKTKKFWSKTTSKHINSWLGTVYEEVPQYEIDRLVNVVSE